MDRRRLLYYLLLNVFVSACVTGSILFWYDRNYRAVTSSSVQPASSGNGQPVSASSTQIMQTDLPIKIESVVGAGTLAAEVAVVKYAGTGQLNLAGWQLKDDNGNTFTFPQITLYQNGAVQIHTTSGTDTVIDLYWNVSDPVWQSGEDARLFDAQGGLRAIYRVP
jgi:lamin tail-like protein